MDADGNNRLCHRLTIIIFGLQLHLQVHETTHSLTQRCKMSKSQSTGYENDHIYENLIVSSYFYEPPPKSTCLTLWRLTHFWYFSKCLVKAPRLGCRHILVKWPIFKQTKASVPTTSRRSAKIQFLFHHESPISCSNIVTGINWPWRHLNLKMCTEREKNDTAFFCFFQNKIWRTCIFFVGALIPLFWTSNDICPGFQSHSGSLVCFLACVILRFTSGAKSADCTEVSMAAKPFGTHTCRRVCKHCLRFGTRTHDHPYHTQQARHCKMMLGYLKLKTAGT